MKKLGVVIVGVNGAVASTLIAGVELMARRLVPRIGMVTEGGTDYATGSAGDGHAVPNGNGAHHAGNGNGNGNGAKAASANGAAAMTTDAIASLVDFAPLEEFVFGGWDVRFDNVYEGALHHKVLPREQLEQVKEALQAVKPWPAAFARPYAQNVVGDHILSRKSFRDEVSTIVKNVEDFKKEHGLERVVMVNLASTEAFLEVAPCHQTIEAFEAALDANDPAISPAMRYFYAANLLGVPYCNFTPSLTHVPALSEHSKRHKTPFAGMDGKTGQTLLKTALASMFRARRLHIAGWYSTNFLGNNDGLVLDAPGSNKTKVLSKAAALDSIVGYHVENHQVHIHYYRPRGDAKEAWDNIDLVGFAGIPMQMKINFLCQDSALAAPLIVDLVRLLDVAKRVGEWGIQRQLSIFFKSPYASPGEAAVHDFFRQEQLLIQWVKDTGARMRSRGSVSSGAQTGGNGHPYTGTMPAAGAANGTRHAESDR